MNAHTWRACGHDGCPSLAKTRGYCQLHYQQRIRSGALKRVSQAPTARLQQDPCYLDHHLSEMVANECAMPWERPAR